MVQPVNSLAYSSPAVSTRLPPPEIPGAMKPAFDDFQNYQLDASGNLVNLNAGQTPDLTEGLAGKIPGGGIDWRNAMTNFGLGAQALTGLAGAYNAYKQNKLMEDQYRASIADRNQQVGNQAKVTNLNLANQAQMAAQMHGYDVGTEGYNKYISENQRQVDGSPIRG